MQEEKGYKVIYTAALASGLEYQCVYEVGEKDAMGSDYLYELLRLNIGNTKGTLIKFTNVKLKREILNELEKSDHHTTSHEERLRYSSVVKLGVIGVTGN